MADCDLCGVSRPTLCPVKIFVPKFRKSYPKGTWKGLCEECTKRLHQANKTREQIGGSKCDLCGTTSSKGIFLYKATITIPNFEEPYSTDETKRICEACLLAVDEVYKKHEARIEGKESHH